MVSGCYKPDGTFESIPVFTYDTEITFCISPFFRPDSVVKGRVDIINTDKTKGYFVITPLDESAPKEPERDFSAQTIKTGNAENQRTCRKIVSALLKKYPSNFRSACSLGKETCVEIEDVDKTKHILDQVFRGMCVLADIRYSRESPMPFMNVSEEDLAKY